MKIRNACALALAALTLIVAAPLVQAQENAPTPPKPAAAPRAVPAEARAIFDRARTVYKLVKTYQDTVKLRFEMHAKDAEGKDVSEDDPEDLTFVYAGPRKFLFRHEGFAIHSDGVTQTGHSIETGNYVQKPAADGLVDEVRTDDIELVCAVHVPANLMISPTRFEKDFPFFTEVTGVKAEALDGKQGKRVSGKGNLPRMPFDQPIAITMWFADSTGMLGEFTMDLKPVYDKMDETMKIERAVGTITFNPAVIDAPIAPETFTFKPADTDHKVDTLIQEEPLDAQLALVGKPAPNFKGLDLDGKPVSLADLKGKVILLDFWATTCPPCMQTLPKIQELSTENAGKDVVIIGVNEDEPDDREDVKRLVETKKLTFRQLMDVEGDVAAAYLVEAIPCSVLIDSKGVVQWVSTGAIPNFKQEIGSRIAKLLKGEALDKEPAKK